MSEATVQREYGVTSSIGRLRRAAMRRPGRAMLEADPERWHYASPIDGARLSAQFEAFVELVRSAGVEIDWIEDEEDDLADSVFTYDPSFVTGSGAILMRPGKAQRLAEVRLHERLYERLGVPVIGRIEAPGVLEGGDCFWLDEHTLAVGRGFRSNQAGIDQLTDIVAAEGVSVRKFDLPMWDGAAACLHLMSVLSPLDEDLMLVYARLLPVALWRLLRDRGVRCLEAPEDEFVASRGLSLNVLATAPRRCIAIDGFPKTARLMEEAGCRIERFEADALCIPCEGGPTCLTRPVLRR